MNQLYVEANKSFNHGFVLPEPELRRFNDLIREQIKKINPEPTITFRYLLKFQNGVVAETDNIDIVFSQENEGSKKIISVVIIGQDQLDNSISVDFYNTDSDNIHSDHSIRYSIKSTDRDWVFVTSSQLEERIQKIKRHNFSLKNDKIFSRLFWPLIPFLGGFIVLFIMLGSIADRDDYLPEIKERYLKGEIKGTDELLFTLEEAKNKKMQDLGFADLFFYPGLTFGILIALYLFFHFYIWKFYPLYNFCWGDYLDIYKKKETARKTFNTVVIIGLLVSIIGGIISNYLNVRI